MKSLMSVLLAFLVFIALSCSEIKRVVEEKVTKTIVGDQNLNQVNQLWSDVPQMEDMAKSDIQMPMGLRTMFNIYAHGVGDTTGDWDFIVFSIKNKTPKDVVNFYTLERMKNYGWEVNFEDRDKLSSGSPCISLGAKDEKQIKNEGLFCVFVKRLSNNREAGLIIISAGKDAIQDTNDQTKETFIYFLRREGEMKQNRGSNSQAE